MPVIIVKFASAFGAQRHKGGSGRPETVSGVIQDCFSRSEIARECRDGYDNAGAGVILSMLFSENSAVKITLLPESSGQAGEPEFPQESRRSSRQEQNVVNYLTENTGKAAALYQKDNLKFDPRSFLLLEGPPGSFFRELGWRLRSLGYDTSFLNLSGGDALERLSFLSL